MNQNSSLKKIKSGLEEDYKARKAKTLKLGQEAIDALIAEGKEVTLHNVLKRQKNSMNKVFILTLFEIMKNSMRIIKQRVKAIRINKKNSKNIFLIVKIKNILFTSLNN